jgi:hypothetical protein
MAEAAPLALSTTTRRPSRRRPVEQGPGGRRSRRPRPGSDESGGRRRARGSRGRGPLADGSRMRGRARPRWPTRLASGSLAPPAAKSLMPLSAKGLWEAEITAAGSWRVGDSARPGPGVGGRRRRPRRPPRWPDRRTGRPAAWDPIGGCPGHQKGPGRQGPGRGPPEGEDQLGPELDVGDAPDAVGAEPDTHRTTASSTGAPCGPSSGRTSCSPSRVRHGSGIRPS